LPEHHLTLLATIVSLVGGYLLGSIPFGLLAAKVGGAGDIRKVGSGNIGATNVLRTGRKDLAAITLLGDGGKGAVAAMIAWALFDRSNYGVASYIAGGAAFVGHLFPVWLGFKGGKGVATFFGVMLALCWPAGLMAGAIWIAVATLLRLSSLAALAAAALAPLFVFIAHGGQPMLILSVLMAILIFIRHHENIRRLLKNEEPRIGAKKAAPADPA
jgi:glycerol-3-phosphate acyltransferase PlsY